MTVITEDSGTQ